MRWLADECVAAPLVATLREAGHDVSYIADFASGLSDTEVLGLARDEHRLLLTEDKDFGELVYAARQKSCGVILLRFPAHARSSMSDALVEAVDRLGARLSSRFTVVQPGRIRIGGSVF